jgi:superfamily II DNA or RNA helicase
MTLPPPPDVPARLPAWAAALGVESLLDSPVGELAPFTRNTYVRRYLELAQPSATIRNVVVAADPGRVALFGGSINDLFPAALAYLAFKKRRRDEEERRATLWAVAPADPALAKLGRRLRTLLETLEEHASVWLPVLFENATVGLAELPPAYVTRFSRVRDGGSIACTIRLEPAPPEPVAWQCDCQRGLWEVRFCAHLRVAAEWLLDALHDPEHELHSSLAALLSRPVWSARLQALSRALPARGATVPAPPEERLVWRVLSGGAHAVAGIETAVQKRTAKGGWTRGRTVSLISVLAGKPFVGVEDRSAVERLEYLVATGKLHGRLGEILEALSGHPRVVAADPSQTPIEVRREALRLRLAGDGADALSLVVDVAGHTLTGAALRRAMLGRSHLAVLDESAGVCHVARVPQELAGALDALSQFPIEDVPLAALDDVLAVAARLAQHAEVALDPAIGTAAVTLDSSPVLRLAPLADGGLEARIAVRPGGTGDAVEPGVGPRSVLRREGERVVQLVRDVEAEVRAAEPVAAALAPLASRTGRWTFTAAGEEAALDLLLAVRDLGREIPIEWQEGAEPRRVGRAVSRALKVRIARKGHLFGVDGEVEVDGELVPLAALLATVRRGARYVRLGPSRFARLERELRERLQSVMRLASTDAHGAVSLGALAATRLPALLGEDIEVDGDGAFAELLARVERAAVVEPEVPAGVTATLRPYQAEGFRWMSRLARWRAGAVLADDMGLGKTLQALVLLLERSGMGPALVVAPTSVCSSWASEAARFAPGLSVVRYRGAGRDATLERLTPGTVLVTSYDILALDIERLASVRFTTLVLDEAQAVKNALTRRAKAARKIDAEVAVALTGTPLENHLGELWSIFRIVSPGLLGSWEHFRERFAAPIERGGDRAALADLVTATRPFLLRRTKAAVAPELPPRTEMVHWVVLSHQHREMYEAARREVLAALATGSGEGERFAILAAITRLRLLACHPRLVDKESGARSAKLAAAEELLGEIVESGQRALVFSQFTSHLALLREALDRRGIAYLYLDGSTPVEIRDRVVRVWQSGEPELFLLSLKAGGRGLNLMGADCVVHLDPWWNPAVEDQATDRTHRIGQEKPVTVVRLITRDTIEEAVLALHESKRELARGVLEGAAAVAAASTDELVALIRDGGASPDEIDEEPEEVAVGAEESREPAAAPRAAAPAPGSVQRRVSEGCSGSARTRSTGSTRSAPTSARKRGYW